MNDIMQVNLHNVGEIGKFLKRYNYQNSFKKIYIYRLPPKLLIKLNLE